MCETCEVVRVVYFGDLEERGKGIWKRREVIAGNGGVGNRGDRYRAVRMEVEEEGMEKRAIFGTQVVDRLKEGGWYCQNSRLIAGCVIWSLACFVVEFRYGQELSGLSAFTDVLRPFLFAIWRSRFSVGRCADPYIINFVIRLEQFRNTLVPAALQIGHFYLESLQQSFGKLTELLHYKVKRPWWCLPGWSKVSSRLSQQKTREH